MDVIEASNLVKRFGELEAVKGVSFSVKEGEIFGFLGPNGAGKTTTINMLCTLLKPTDGQAKVNGYDVIKERSQVRQSIGLVFQEPSLDDYLTAEQNLRFHGYAYGIPKNVLEPRLKELLEMMELWDRRKGKINTYSGGMKRRLEIARGLLHHPRVLFLDEPTLGLDPQTRRRIWDYIHDLRKRENLAIFMTTHYMDEAENCDRIAIIDYGRTVALDTLEKLKDGVGGDVISVKTEDNEEAMRLLEGQYKLKPGIENGIISFTVPHGEEFLPKFVSGFPLRLLSIGLRRPTLEDVFLKLTGRNIREQEVDSMQQMKNMARMRGH
ncbi:MAG: ATP-binding cassette domain-containing protein [Dehalococcoidia bacterium]|nr:MAG: ATP-binding cassette domain-containing protein [Dehalococcoidia bacterium]